MIRIFESNQKTLYAAEDRKKQEREKALQRQIESEERKKWDLAWEKDRLLKEEKYVCDILDMNIPALLPPISSLGFPLFRYILC